jgi:GNAT superfamily N-acetyltransferase
MPSLRRATPADAALITAQRHHMFADNGLATDVAYSAMDASFLPWVTERLADGRYVGLFFEEEAAGASEEQPVTWQDSAAEAHQTTILAAAGIFFADFPPHFLDPAPTRAYLLNFYTAPQARGRGLATHLLHHAVAECRARNVRVVTLHASRFGRPIYERFGFAQNNELILKAEV